MSYEDDIYPVTELIAHWAALADQPVSPSGTLLKPFLHFPVGTQNFAIFNWFESQCPLFSAEEAQNGNFTVDIGNKRMVSIEIDLDPAGVLREREVNTGVADLSKEMIHEVLQDEIGYALDEIKPKLVSGYVSGGDQREQGECAYHFTVEDIEPMTVERLRGKMNGHLEAVLKLALEEMTGTDDIEEASQQMSICNAIQAVIHSVHGIEESDLKPQ